MKKFLSIIIAVIIVFAMPVYSAADSRDTNPTIFAESVSGHEGQTVDVPVKISGNPGIVALMLTVSYDNEFMTLINVTDNGLLGRDTSVFNDNLNSIPYKMLWEDGLAQSNYTDNGTLVILTFTINSQTTKTRSDLSLTLTDGFTFDKDLTDVSFEIQNGEVILGDESTDIFSIDDSVIFDYKNKYIIVNKFGLENIDEYIESTNHTEYIFSSEKIGTGSKLRTLSEDNSVTDEYLIIVTGDLNGDSFANGMDAVLVDCINNNLLTEENTDNILFIAADYNHDNVIDCADSFSIEQSGVFLANVD